MSHLVPGEGGEQLQLSLLHSVPPFSAEVEVLELGATAEEQHVRCRHKSGGNEICLSCVSR